MADPDQAQASVEKEENEEELKERLEREHGELLEELRSLIPGAEVLFGFLLAIRFTGQFGDLGDTQRYVYYVTLLSTATALVFLLALEGARAGTGRQEGLAPQFVSSLVPIALAYSVAHYFSLLVLQGQQARRLASDPFGYGWDLLGTADWQPRLDLLTPNTIWYVQVGVLVVGHVLGLMLAHDRAVTLFRSPGVALRSQYPMLVLMVGYTVSGLWLLSND